MAGEGTDEEASCLNKSVEDGGSDSEESTSSRSDEFQGVDAMDVETYRLVLRIQEPKIRCSKKRTGDIDVNVLSTKRLARQLQTGVAHTTSALRSEWEMILHNEEIQYAQAEIKLRQDFSANKVRWYGHWRKDLWCFLRNTNPVVSICYSHPLHPVSRCKRLIGYLLQMLFVLDIAMALTEGRKCFDCGIRNCETSIENNECYLQNVSMPVGRAEVLQQYPLITRNFCCTCESLGILGTFQIFGKLWGGPVYATITNCLFTVFVFQMLMCNAVMHKDVRHREIGTIVGKLIVGAVLVSLLALAPLLFFWISVKHMGMELLYNFILGKLGSWAFVTLVNITAFSIFWRQQAPGRKRKGPPFNVTAEQFVAYLDEEYRDSTHE
jgi:hypothetical protein